MERGALSTAEFKEFAKDYVLFCHITSMVEGEKYPKLLQEKGGRGFPYVVAMDAEGEVILPHNGARTTEGFAETMKKAVTYRDLQAKEDRTPAENVELFLIELGIGKYDFDAAKSKAAELTDVSEEDQAKIDDALLGLEIMHHAPKTRGPDAAAASGKIYTEMYRNGRMPKDKESRAFQTFFILIMEHAFQNNDVALFEEGLGKLKEAFGDDPRAAKFFEQQNARLEQLKSKAAAGSGD